MKLFILLFIPFTFFAQTLYQGPATGNVTGGASISTGAVPKAVVSVPAERAVRQKLRPEFSDPGTMPGKSPFNLEEIYSEDKLTGKTLADTSTTVLMQNFGGITQTNSIPPDPHMAAGPEHIIATVNSDFAIYKKDGTKLVQIGAAQWFNNVLTGTGPFDPKVIYDHYAKRWIMVWLDQDDATKKGVFLVSVSDDSIPTGTWYNWALPSNVNGNTFDNTWSDYQGVGFDDKALYITGDQFSFTGSFSYTKIRVIPKQQLLANNAGPVSWFDLWDIRDPRNSSSKVFNIRPSICYTPGSTYHLLHSPYSGTNYVILYKLSNVLTAPSLTANAVTVTTFSNPPTPVQKGNNSIALEGSSSGLNNEPVFRDSILWAVHTVRNPSYSSNSAVHFFGINVNTNTLNSENFFGQQGYFYMYPSIMVDRKNNVAITYSRCSANEFIGAYFSTRRALDASMKGSFLLKEGKDEYVKDFGSGRNRWGDYMGMSLDPVNFENFWMLTEYVPAKNVWDTWIGTARVQPFAGTYPYSVTKICDFSNIEVGFQSDTVKGIISNFGNTAFTIDSVKYNKNVFLLPGSVTFPRVMNPFDSLYLPFVFKPKASQIISDTMLFYSNGGVAEKIVLKARGFVINNAATNKVYAASAGKVLTVNKNTGAATVLGESNFDNVASLAIDPVTKVMYGLVKVLPAGASVVRVNGDAGDAYVLAEFPTVPLITMAFDTTGKLYLATRTGLVYRMNFTQKTLIYVDSVKANLNTITFHPRTNEMWAGIFKAIGLGRDMVMRVRLGTGDTVQVGRTGSNFPVAGMYFDYNGRLYGSYASTTTESNYIQIDTATGAGTLVTTFSLPGVAAFALLSDPATKADNSIAGSAAVFDLQQNFPNPFNPSTSVRFSLPVAGYVTLRVYNLLGETVHELFAGEKSQGVYEYRWSPETGLSSGIYFVELKARSAENSYQSIKKMVYSK